MIKYLLLLFVNLIIGSKSNHFLNLHNNFRDLTNQGKTYDQPPAVNIPHLKWDEGLAQVAQDYAEECYWGHNGERKSDLYSYTDITLFNYDGFKSVGENMYMSTSSKKVNNITYGGEYAVKRWYKEYDYYDYDSNTCQDGKSCGHYTQVIWADTEYIGCGSTVCKYIDNKGWENALLVVCDYFPGGNYRGRWPYEKA